jgi:hypothetical protein
VSECTVCTERRQTRCDVYGTGSNRDAHETSNPSYMTLDFHLQLFAFLFTYCIL